MQMNAVGMKTSRRQQILTALAKMLEDSPGERISTTLLAKEVGVSAAALYRHFPSKAKMFEGLIALIEETVFAKITVLLAEESRPQKRCEQIVFTLLTFAERNPGLSRLLVGDALMGETERLRQRIAHFSHKVEEQLIHVLTEASIQKDLRLLMPPKVIAHLLMVYVDGSVAQFVRSEFQRLPTLNWLVQWQAITPSVFFKL